MLQSVVIGISLILNVGSENQWDACLPLLSSLPPSVENIQIDILPFKSLNDKLAIPFPDPKLLHEALLRLPTIRSLTFRWGLKEEDLRRGMGKILSERVSRLIPEMWKDGVLRCEWHHFNKIYQSTGVPTDMGLLFPI